MENLPQQTPTPTPKANLGVVGSVAGLIGFFLFGLPLGAAAIIMGAIDQPKTTWSYVSIVIGIVDVVAVLYVLGSY
jgi:hypothetical protein